MFKTPTQALPWSRVQNLHWLTRACWTLPTHPSRSFSRFPRSSWAASPWLACPLASGWVWPLAGDGGRGQSTPLLSHISAPSLPEPRLVPFLPIRSCWAGPLLCSIHGCELLLIPVTALSLSLQLRGWEGPSAVAKAWGP